MSRRFVFIALACVMALTLVWGSGGATRASAQSMGFASATSDCWVGRFTVNYPLGSQSSLLTVSRQQELDEGAVLYVTAVDSKGTFLGDYNFYIAGLNMTGAIWYSSVPVKSVTLTLYYVSGVDDTSQQNLGAHRGGRLARPATQSLIPLDKVTIPVDCTETAPGCDITIEKPDGSVIGQFTKDAETYWTPGELTTNPAIALPAGKTAWVLGKDLSREYYKIIWGCSYLWVKVETMGPNPDNLWQNTPLPDRTVK